MVFIFWQNWGEHIGRQLNHHLTSSLLADLTISVGKQSIKVHRMVLSFFSSLFKEMLQDVSDERPMVVVLPGVNFKALEMIVAYMYRGQVNISEELMSDVIDLAKILQVKGLFHLQSKINETKESSCSITQDSNMSFDDFYPSKVDLEVTAPEIDLSQPIDQDTHQPEPESRTVSPFLIRIPSTTDIESVKEFENAASSHIEETSINENLCSLPPPSENPPQCTKKKKPRASYKQSDLKYALDELRSGNRTLQEVSLKWGVPKSTLSLTAREAGLEIRRCHHYDKKSLSAAIQAVIGGQSYLQASRNFNIPKTVIWRRCRKQGIIHSDVRPYSTEDVLEAKNMLLQNIGLSVINRHTNIPTPSLFRIKEQLIKEGKLDPSSIVRCKRVKKSEKYLKNLELAVQSCWKEGMSQIHASEKYKVSKLDVCRGLKKVKNRSPHLFTNIVKTEEVTMKPNSYTFSHQVTDQEDPLKIDKSDHVDLSLNEEIFDPETEVHIEQSETSEFDIEMPLVNFPESSYKVVGDEIVIDGQQVVIIDSQQSSAVSTHLGASHTDKQLHEESIVFGTIDENGMVQLK